MAEHQLPKLTVRVRFPSSAPRIIPDQGPLSGSSDPPYLTPLGVYRILGIPGSALARGVHHLEDVSPSLASLPDRLASLPTWGERFAVVDEVLVRMAERIGVTPKMAASVIRFEQAASALSSKQSSLVDLAAAYGYADQSHLTRKFVRFAGDTPAAYAASNRPSVAGVIGQL